MTEDDKKSIAAFFASKGPSTVRVLAAELNISREAAARRVRACIDAGIVKECGREDRTGQGIRGQRPIVYQAI